MAQLHMTEAEVSHDFAGALNRVTPADEIVVDRAGEAVAVIRPINRNSRTLGELIEWAAAREAARGNRLVPDDEFARDVDDIVRARKPWTPAWE